MVATLRRLPACYDTALVSHRLNLKDTITSLQTLLDATLRWFNTWRLNINQNKSKLIIFNHNIFRTSTASNRNCTENRKTPLFLSERRPGLNHKVLYFFVSVYARSKVTVPTRVTANIVGCCSLLSAYLSSSSLQFVILAGCFAYLLIMLGLYARVMS